jgi:hypothetical protein
MSFNFPSPATEGQVVTFVEGPSYQYSGGVWNRYATGSIQTAQSRNRIVNGAMQVSQENGDTATAGYPVDQWSTATNLTVLANRHPSIKSPNGSRVIQPYVTTAKPALAAGDFWRVNQSIEGIRIADFLWGTASARQVVLRFWVSAQTTAGTYTVQVQNAAANRTFLAPFSAPLYPTWKEVVIVIPGDTTGVWPTDNSFALLLAFTLAAGTTFQGVAGWQAGNLVGIAGSSNGAAVVNNSLLISDVGLYLDPLGTNLPPPWQMPDEAEELLACQRYFQWFPFNFSFYSSVASMTIHTPCALIVKMRTTPTTATITADPEGIGAAAANNAGNVAQAMSPLQGRMSLTATAGGAQCTVQGYRAPMIARM